jgi:hypothetical protein
MESETMFEHLFCNAHGEWTLLGLIPLAVTWWRMRRAKGCCGSDDGHRHP